MQTVVHLHLGCWRFVCCSMRQGGRRRLGRLDAGSGAGGPGRGRHSLSRPSMRRPQRGDHGHWRSRKGVCGGPRCRRPGCNPASFRAADVTGGHSQPTLLSSISFTATSSEVPSRCSMKCLYGCRVATVTQSANRH